MQCRSPYGERGLKCRGQVALGLRNMSLSLRRAWIEMAADCIAAVTGMASLSLRRAWIEITRRSYGRMMTCVALLTESVD